jgi:hypothetical protein
MYNLDRFLKLVSETAYSDLYICIFRSSTGRCRPPGCPEADRHSHTDGDAQGKDAGSDESRSAPRNGDEPARSTEGGWARSTEGGWARSTEGESARSTEGESARSADGRVPAPDAKPPPPRAAHSRNAPDDNHNDGDSHS